MSAAPRHAAVLLRGGCRRNAPLLGTSRSHKAAFSLSACGRRAHAAVAAEPGASSSASRRPVVWYQSDKVPTSVAATGKVGTYRDGSGSDSTFFGVDPVAVEVDIQDARGRGLNLHEHGVELRDHCWDHVDYYDNESVLRRYYPECEAIVCEALGASSAVAFDHNLRAKAKKESSEQLKSGGNAVQEPLVTYGVHNDYTAASAPRRLELLTQPPKSNDTLRILYGDRPILDPLALPDLLRKRWAIVNVWRNVTTAPVQRFPLAACEATSTSVDDLVVFEVRYSDRTGENYFARHNTKHRWSYFPHMTRDEVVLLKCWDSRGVDFASDVAGKAELVPSTFSLHTAFDDPATPDGAPDRESIEVRLAAFFD